MAGWAQAIPWILSGLSGLSGLLSGKDKKTQSTSSTGTINETDTTTPNYDPLALLGRDTVLKQYMDRLTNNQGFMTGYTGQGMSKINQGAGIRQNTLSNILSARGLNSSPVGASLMDRGEGDRIRQLTDFYSGVPLVADQRQLTNLQGLGEFVSSLPTGMTVNKVGSTSSTGTGQTQGSTEGALGSGLSDAVSAYLLSKYYGKG